MRVLAPNLANKKRIENLRVDFCKHLLSLWKGRRGLPINYSQCCRLFYYFFRIISNSRYLVFKSIKLVGLSNKYLSKNCNNASVVILYTLFGFIVPASFINYRLTINGMSIKFECLVFKILAV